MTGDVLKAKLTEFYGVEFYIAASKELNVDQSTIYRWIAADKIPGPVEAWVRERSKKSKVKGR